jgi:hypothetical protein
LAIPCGCISVVDLDLSIYGACVSVHVYPIVLPVLTVLRNITRKSKFVSDLRRTKYG